MPLRAHRTRVETGIGVGTLAPGERENYPPGTVFLKLAMRGERTSRAVTLPGARSRVRSYPVISLLDYLRKTPVAEG